MSNPILNQCWPLQMPASAKSVLIVLADLANDETGRCWPRIETIAERTCLHRTTVMEALQWLEAANAVSADRKRGRNTKYQLTLDLFNPAVQTTSRRATSRAIRPLEDQKESGIPTTPTTEVVGQTDSSSRAFRPEESGKPTPVVGHSDTNPQEPIVKPPITPQPRAKKSSADLLDGFAEFWAEYPNKTNKLNASKSWQKKGLHTDLSLRATVMSALARHRTLPQWTKDGGQYVPHATTWLNQERYLDDVGSPMRPGQSAQCAAAGDWWTAAGFANHWEAANHRCYQHNAHTFRDGKRLANQAEVHA